MATANCLVMTGTIVVYWATSISTVRTTVLSEKVIKTDLFPDLDITFRILDTLFLCGPYRKLLFSFSEKLKREKVHDIVDNCTTIYRSALLIEYT